MDEQHYNGFFSVFPELKFDSGLMNLMSLVTVEKIATNRDKSTLKVYILSARIISGRDIKYMEREMEGQLFGRSSVKVILSPRYTLSKQYTPENLWNEYKETIYDELRDINIMMYNMLRRADVEFTDSGHMKLTLEKSVIGEKKESGLIDYIREVFENRCGLFPEIKTEYKEIKESRYRKQQEQKVENEVARIMQNRALAMESANQSLSSKESAHKESIQKENQQKENTQKENTQKENLQKKGVQEKASDLKAFARDTKAGGEKKFFRREGYKSDNPDVIYGREFDDEYTRIADVSAESGVVAIKGQIIAVDTREIRNERTIVSFAITDFTDTIRAKMFIKNELLLGVMDSIKVGNFIKIKGMALFDTYDKEVSIASVTGIMKAKDDRTPRMDTSVEKRVELHCHTKMSDMDGVSDAGDIIKTAIKWGHRALAITDHGCVQGFTDALHALDKIKDDYKKKGEELDFKVLYGVEAYLVDDLKDIVTDSCGQSLDDTYVVFDIETTGFSAAYDKIIEIGAVKVVGGKIEDKFSKFINPKIPIPFRIEELTGINDSMVMDADTVDVVLPLFLEFCRGAVMVAHNADFDMSFIFKNASDLGIDFKCTIVDTVSLARVLLPTLNRYKLDTVAKAVGVSLEHHHRAVDDAGCTAGIFVKFIEMLKERGISGLDDVNIMSRASETAIKKLPSHHAIIIAKNETGRINLYRLVSNSHIKYFNRQPRIPKSDFLANREGLIIGSACEAGELYQAVYGGKSDAEIARLVNFYDYLEIQPLGNNMFMVNKGETTVENLIEVNKKIVSLGERFNKPVAATCDVHFLNPEDEVYRRIIMAGKGFDDADNQAPLFFRTTEEMLDEFKYLGSDKAYEVVVTNTNKIADMIENISPVHPDKAPPVIPDSDRILRDICYNTAHAMYGEELPEVVTERLERELNSIISNGFAVMYIIAQKLVWKSNEDGYLVGSRGSVGSSFVATMSGITEVNPLRPHYFCSKCHYSDFDSDLVKSYGGSSGCDMPDMKCPKCGEELVKAGFDIPFETFLGFKGNKEPDIDLNFSGEYQSKAHEYTEVIFGKGQTFRAGTIGTLADKTAYGFVKKYYEERGIPKRSCEIERIVQGCVGVRRTTGQHPGGIIVLPYGEEIYKFTPVQRPANDMTTKTITTHFDYHSIDHNLLKLDILGHDDPTMIRMLEDLTGIDAKTIRFDDKGVLSLFESTEALGITPEDIGGCPLGCLGIPEFGTDFVIQMLLDTKPKTMSDLIRISGLSHGTDVWLGNAQTLIQEGKATISTAICTRDDIMTYLIGMGLDSEESFKIMEAVRKGTVAKGKCGNWEEWKADMLSHGVPDWYVWSCEKIQYMFPKAHAAAYVMMAFRIAWFKINYPLAYYASFFSIRASAFDYELMCQGRDKLEYFLAEYKKQNDAGTLSKVEQDKIKDMKIVQEMYARGFEFTKLDLYKAQATKFQIEDGKLMPALASISGMGDKAAEAVVEAAKDGKFLSKDDFGDRTKVSKTVIDLMSDLGLMEDLPETNQLSLFDFV